MLMEVGLIGYKLIDTPMDPKVASR